MHEGRLFHDELTDFSAVPAIFVGTSPFYVPHGPGQRGGEQACRRASSPAAGDSRLSWGELAVCPQIPDPSLARLAGIILAEPAMALGEEFEHLCAKRDAVTGRRPAKELVRQFQRLDE